MPTIPRNQIVPGEGTDSNHLNTALNQIIDLFNTHNHDPNDPALGGQGLMTTSIVQAGASGATEPVVVPSSGAGAGTYIQITSTATVETELSRVRAQLARIIGGNWYDNTGAAVRYDSGTSNITTTGIVTANTLTLNAASGTAPMTIPNTSSVVNNLNAQYHNSFLAYSTQSSQAPGSFVNTIAALDNYGFFPPSLVRADMLESANMDTLTNNVSDYRSNANRLRAVLLAYAQALGGSTWNYIPSTLVGSLGIYNGIPRGGALSLYPGNGVSISEQAPGVFRIDNTGVTMAVPGGLTFADFFQDSVITGLNVIAATGLNVTVQPGRGYVVGGGVQLIYPQTIGPLTASTTNYIWWDGGVNASDFIINTTGVQPANTIPLATVITNATSVTTITDTRSLASIFKTHIGTTGAKPTTAGAAGLGSTGTATVLTPSNDTAGRIQFVPNGTGIAAGNMFTVTYAQPHVNTPTPQLFPVTPATGALRLWINGYTPTSFTVYCENAPFAGTTYELTYHVLGIR